LLVNVNQLYNVGLFGARAISMVKHIKLAPQYWPWSKGRTNFIGGCFGKYGL